MSAAVSVVIRAKDEAPSIGRVIDILERQTVTPQIIVVDSGSTDGTVDIVRARDVELIEIPAASFTFGGSLNTGAAAATADVVVALSAHAFPWDDGWLAAMLDAMADPKVACASGQAVGPEGEPLTDRRVQDIALARGFPLWGYSSHAGAFRTELWRQRGFRTDMPATEDKEWSWYWMERGYTTVLAPDLNVDHGHGHDPASDQYRRARIEWTGLGMFTAVEPMGVLEVVGRWWARDPHYDSALRARLSPKRMARLAGTYVGRRAGARQAATRS